MISHIEQGVYNVHVYAAIIALCVLSLLLLGPVALPFVLIGLGFFLSVRFIILGHILRSSKINSEHEAQPILPDMILSAMGQNERIQYAITASRVSDNLSLVFCLSALPFLIWTGFFQQDLYQMDMIRDLWLKIQTALAYGDGDGTISSGKINRIIELYGFYGLCGMACITSRAFMLGSIERHLLLILGSGLFLLTAILHLWSAEFVSAPFDFKAEDLAYWQGHGLGFYELWSVMSGSPSLQLSPYHIRLIDLGMTGVILSSLPFCMLGLIFLRNLMKASGKVGSEFNTYRFSLCMGALSVLGLVYYIDRFLTYTPFSMGMMLSACTLLGVLWSLSTSLGQRQWVFIQR